MSPSCLCFRQLSLFALLGFAAPSILAQTSPNDQIQVAPPVRQIQAPSKDASVQDLEKEGDLLRARKENLDAIDYYRAALNKSPRNAALLNKICISELLLQRYKEAAKDCEQSIKADPKFADAHNNLGVTDYLRRRYGAAVKHYKKALELDRESASFYNNLGAAYFARKAFERASQAYSQAIRLDPEIFEHSSHTGVAAQVTSSEDRAHYEYVLAKLYAKAGDRDHSIEYLRKAVEDGYKGVTDAYKDPEFAELRKDPKFADLMKQKTPVIPE